MSESELKAALGNRRILFVDDDPPLVADYRDALRDAGLNVVVKKTLSSGMRLIREDASSIGLALVDLSMPGDRPDDLAQRYHELTRANGQLLGQWLWDDHRGQPPYAYFTAYPNLYQPHPNAVLQEFETVERARRILILDKFNIRPSQLLECLKIVLVEWNNLCGKSGHEQAE